MINTFKKLYYKTLHIGIDKDDSEELKLKKISITIVPIIMGPVGLIWSLILFSLGHLDSATISFSYAFLSLISLFIFKQNKNILFIQKTQMLLVLLIPFLLMWSLGGFALGSYMMIWAFFSPIAALIHNKGSKTFYWLSAFIALVIFSALIDSYLISHTQDPLPSWAIELFFVLNISVALSGIYFLIYYFIKEKEKNANNTIGDNISYLQSYKDSIDKNLIVTRTDTEGKITFANENFYKISGYKAEEVIGRSHNIIRHPSNSDSLFEQMWRTILQKKTWHGRIQNKRKDGSDYWIETTIAPILNNKGDIVEFIAIRHDITKLLAQQDALLKMLYFDKLTGLHNRNSLLKEIQEDKYFSLILINVDNFSQINDLYGEKFGDQVLLKFSKYLSKQLEGQQHCKLYRFSGDEFVILSEDTLDFNVTKLAKDLVQSIDTSLISIQDQDISLSITVGISFEENILLLSTANMAVKQARRLKKNISVFSDALSLNVEYENNIKWIKEIKDAIKEDRITMYYQPIVDNSDNSINKYETLVRLIDREGNAITPNHFLEIAKKAKLYKEITKIVLRKSFEAFKDNDYDFSINITIDDILDPFINSYILEIIQEYKISHRVIFEIVESESIENFEEIERFIIMIKSFGCRVSIDDFGTGYSNFEHLMRLQADFIKIDGSIIKEITKDKRSALITSVIVAFAKEMGIQTIGEFVENKETNDKLIKLGVNKSQGYYFDRPQATLGKK